MHKFLLLATLVAAAACGGGSKTPPTPPEPPPSPCIAMAAHMRAQVVKAGEAEQAGADLLAKIAPVVERVVSERCQADAWSAEVIACINAADDKSMDPCIEQLTDAQEQAIESQLDRELEGVMPKDDAGEAPKSAPPPPAPGGGAPPEDPDGGGA